MKNLYYLLLLISMLQTVVRGQEGTVQKYITVDQFGYRPGDMKYAVLANPQVGFNASESFVPGATYEVRKWGTDETVYSGTPELWNQGAVHENSGDRGWQFEFTDVQDDGDYYLYDVQNEMRSYKFHIGDDVYEDVLKAAMRMFYYNRSGIAKEAPYAEGNWIVNEVFNENEVHSYFVDDMDNEDLVRDMSKGWMDAGDSNKYVTFTSSPMHQLLTSYTENTSMWNALNLNIPESGNNVPDILDELKWELDWLMKMQDMDDGGVFLKIGVRGFGAVPWEDDRKRFYEQKCSSSTIAAAGMFAHAHLVYKNIPGMADYSEELKRRAELAWSNFKDLNEGIFETDCDPQYDPNKPYVVDGDGSGVCCGDADREVSPQKGEASVAAAYLLGATGEQKYQDAFLEYYESNANYVGYTTWGQYSTFMGDALTYYIGLPNADQSAKANIINNKTSGSTNAGLFIFEKNDDLYNAAFNSFHWGSAQVRSNLGNAAFDFVRYGINRGNNDKYIQRAKNLLHHFHGVNPLSMAYLTNMKESGMIKYGAEFSVSEVFHTWFEEGTEYDNAIANAYGPAPGFLPGGPNSRYDDNLPYKVKLGNTLYDGEIRNQPNEKAFTVENLGWDDELQQITNSWQLNEPGIYYQAAYIKLLANFVGKDSKDGSIDVGDPSNFVAATLLKEVEQGDAFNASINYTSGCEATIILRLMDNSMETPTEVIAISENVAAGTNETTLGFDIPADLPVGDFYTVDISLKSRDLQTELAFYPGQPLTVYLPGEKPLRHSVAAEIPTDIAPGTALTFDLDYYTEDDGNLFVNVFETSTGDWVPVFDGSSTPILANTSGTETFRFEIPEDIDAEGSYFVWLTIFDAGWSNILAREQINISFQDDTSAPATENGISAEIPTSFTPGTTTAVEITYSTLEDANIFINLFDDSSGEWVALNDGASISVVAGSTGTTTLDITVPEGAREGDGYVVFLNMFNSDYGATLASFPNTEVSVGAGTAPPTRNSITATIPETFAPGSATPIEIEYSAIADANIFLNLFDTSSGEWVELNSGASAPIDGNTSGTISLDITVPDGAREGDGYIVFLNMFNSDYGATLASFPNTEVSVGAGTATPTRNSITATIPETFAPGSATPIEIEYSAIADANIFLNLFDTSSGEWVELNSGASAPIDGNTSGTISLDITVPDGAREGDGYVVFLNMFNSDYGATLASFPNTEVSVGAGTATPTRNSITATIPETFAPGSATPIEIEYSAIADANIFLNLFDTSSGEWVELNSGASAPIDGNTSGTISLDITVPEGTREGDGYIVFLNMFDSDYGATLASFPNTEVSVGGNTVEVVENLLLTSICSENPNAARNWRVRNPNNFDIAVRWEVYGTDQSGGLTVPMGDSFFETEAINGSNTTKIYWSDESGIEKSTTKASSGARCETVSTYVYIKNKELGDYLRPASNTVNAEILVAENDGSDWFKWEKVATDAGFFILKNKQTGMHFRPMANASGSPMQQKPASWTGSWVQWSETPAADGRHSYLVNKATESYIRPISAQNRALVLRPNSWNGNWTQWLLESAQNGLVTAKTQGLRKAHSFFVHPNPVTDTFILENKDFEGNFYLYDFNGRLVRRGFIKKDTSKGISVQALPTGIYSLQLGTAQLKIIKR